MKKRFFMFFTLLLIGLASASNNCDLEVSLLNQDPYPAVPGDYVKIVFSVSGIQSSDCGVVSLQLLEKYPLSFDPGFNSTKTIDAGTFAKGFSSNWIVPYKVRIDKDALDGNSEIDISYTTRGQKDFRITKSFSIKIEEVKADFDIFVKNYDYSTNKLILEIINLGKKDVYSLTITILEQENIKVLGGNKNIVGDIDSRDYTSTEFSAIPKDGKIKVLIEYIDTIGERRKLEKELLFNSAFFEHTKKNGKTSPIYFVIGIAVLVLIAFLIYKKKIF